MNLSAVRVDATLEDLQLDVDVRGQSARAARSWLRSRVGHGSLKAAARGAGEAWRFGGAALRRTDALERDLEACLNLDALRNEDEDQNAAPRGRQHVCGGNAR